MRPANGAWNDVAIKSLAWSAHALGRVGFLRHALAAAIERRMRCDAARPNPRQPDSVNADKLAISLAILNTMERAAAEGRVSKAAAHGMLRVLGFNVLAAHGDRTPKERFREEHGCTPPDFIAISPGKDCNLKCTGCYANSGPAHEKLDWDTLERLVTDARDNWGARFFVLTGGEPLVYRADGKSVLDLAARHRDCFFVMYTNGTMIDARMARRMAELGNLGPALSVEGMRERTDARRGTGVFDKVVSAAEHLRREGVIFGISLTATSENADEILSDDVVDLFFGQLGAFWAFVFHYMPIGRANSLELMPTAEQRYRLWERSWSLIREKRLFIADFWNGGTLTNGCIAAGRPGGYVHVNWNGHVSPCVFVPYAAARVQDVYAAGGSLTDIWKSPFFDAVRQWQSDYGYRERGQHCDSCGNWLKPCLFRDHHAEFMRIAHEHRPEPTDADARAALHDPAYHERLLTFDRQLSALVDPIWKERYERPS
jgi:MoaA/NifB/PqqE/SkfB family radical SAM enzyme